MAGDVETQTRNRINARKRAARKVAMDKASELEMRAARCQSMGLSLLQDATKAMVEAALDPLHMEGGRRMKSSKAATNEQPEAGPMEARWRFVRRASVEAIVSELKEQDAKIRELTAEREGMIQRGKVDFKRCVDLTKKNHDLIADRDRLREAIDAIDLTDDYVLNQADNDELIIVRRPKSVWVKVRAALEGTEK